MDSDGFPLEDEDDFSFSDQCSDDDFAFCDTLDDPRISHMNFEKPTFNPEEINDINLPIKKINQNYEIDNDILGILNLYIQNLNITKIYKILYCHSHYHKTNTANDFLIKEIELVEKICNYFLNYNDKFDASIDDEMHFILNSFVDMIIETIVSKKSEECNQYRLIARMSNIFTKFEIRDQLSTLYLEYIITEHNYKNIYQYIIKNIKKQNYSDKYYYLDYKNLLQKLSSLDNNIIPYSNSKKEINKLFNYLLWEQFGCKLIKNAKSYVNNCDDLLIKITDDIFSFNLNILKYIDIIRLFPIHSLNKLEDILLKEKAIICKHGKFYKRYNLISDITIPSEIIDEFIDKLCWITDFFKIIGEKINTLKIQTLLIKIRIFLCELVACVKTDVVLIRGSKCKNKLSDIKYKIYNEIKFYSTYNNSKKHLIVDGFTRNLVIINSLILKEKYDISLPNEIILIINGINQNIICYETCQELQNITLR